MNLSPKLKKDLDDAAVMVESIKWSSFSPEGSCIPIAYALNEFLTLRKRPSRVTETTLEGRDSVNRRWFQIEPSGAFLGHTVVIMPASHLLLDGSLWTQKSKVLDNFELPRLFIMPWNRELGATGRMGRLTLRYKPNLTANEWRRRSWPWTEIRNAVIAINQDLKEFDA